MEVSRYELNSLSTVDNTSLSKNAKIGIGVGVTLLIVAAILIPLGVLGYLTPSNNAEDDVPNTCDLLTGKFNIAQQLVGTTPVFGYVASADKTGEYVVGLSVPALIQTGHTITTSVYQKNGNTFQELSNSTWDSTLPQTTKTVAMSHDAQHVAAALGSEDLELVSTLGALKFGVRAGNNWFGTPQTFTVDGNEPVDIWFDTEVDTRCYVGWNKINAPGITGEVHVYDLTESTWSKTGTLPNISGGAGDGFGVSVQQAGNYLVASNMGTILTVDEHPPSGVNYYTRANATEAWVYQGVVAPPTTVPISFGYKTDIDRSGLWMVISAPFAWNEAKTQPNGGRVYIYHRTSVSETFSPTPNTVLVPPNPNSLNLFGTALQISGNYLFVAGAFLNETTRHIRYYLLDSGNAAVNLVGSFVGPITGTGTSFNEGVFGLLGFTVTHTENTFKVITNQNATTDEGFGSLLGYQASCE